MNNPKLSLALAGLCLFQSGWILGASGQNTAFADDDVVIINDGGPISPRLLCQTFSGAAQQLKIIETSDRSTPIGEWIGSKEGDWILYTLDYELGSKSTGFPFASVQVCLSPAY